MTADVQPERSAPWDLMAQDAELWQSLHRLLKAANNAMPASAKRLDIARIDMTILELVMERPYLPSELARNLKVTQAAISIAINRLAERGLVHRRQDSQDRRKTFVEITAQGRKNVAAELAGTFAQIHQTVAAISESDRKAITKFLQAVNQILDDHTERLN